MIHTYLSMFIFLKFSSKSNSFFENNKKCTQKTGNNAIFCTQKFNANAIFCTQKYI